jgi:NAD(P)-dependent dehydrogenase (short-subunit alcohol dehydrogenase family)
MPGFIKSSAKGKFQGTTIILMGCDGLKSDAMAEAFVQKGAKAVVAWDGLVSPQHTDAAIERLLQHLLKDGLTLQEAVAQTMAEVGPDPSYESVLRLYPSEEPASATP